MQSSGEGAALVLESEAGRPALRLFCPAGAGTILVNVAAFKPIGSEERLSFGHGGLVEALVADPNGDVARGGMTGTGPVPRNVASLLSGRISVSYGNQVSGPHPVPPADVVADFASACLEDVVVGDTESQAEAGTATANLDGLSPCLLQDGRALPAINIRGVGTEPFWGVAVEGRCVTYSHPEDQVGTRVWTKFSGTVDRGEWTGALDGHPFVMRTRRPVDCSDGMSDKRYPIAVLLAIGGEERTGCAERR